jgi:hypothetical protein
MKKSHILVSSNHSSIDTLKSIARKNGSKYYNTLIFEHSISRMVRYVKFVGKPLQIKQLCGFLSSLRTRT